VGGRAMRSIGGVIRQLDRPTVGVLIVRLGQAAGHSSVVSDK
jgi:hypothetical protein